MCVYMYIYVFIYLRHYSDDLFSNSILQQNMLCCIQNIMYSDCDEYAFQKKKIDSSRSAFVACLLFQPILKQNPQATK